MGRLEALLLCLQVLLSNLGNLYSPFVVVFAGHRDFDVLMLEVSFILLQSVLHRSLVCEVNVGRACWLARAVDAQKKPTTFVLTIDRGIMEEGSQIVPRCVPRYATHAHNQ